MSLFLAILAIGLMIVVHEWGHFFVARKSGMRVERFSVGFGPTLLSKQVGETTYQVAAIPLGGYVKIAGMDPNEELPEDDPGSYNNKPLWKRALTVAAGPLTNYVFAAILAVIVFTVWGLPKASTKIADLESKLPAAAAGLRVGDEIVRVDGQPVASVLDLKKALIASAKDGVRPVEVQFRRDGKLETRKITPVKEKRGILLGVLFAEEYQPVPTGQAIKDGVVYPVVFSAAILKGLGRIFSGREKAQFMGPVGIGKEMMKRIDRSAAQALLFLALLNVYLGLFNLLPLPALDGGRLLFLGIEADTRRKVAPRVEAVVHTVGFFLLLAMLILVTVKDVRGG